MRVSKTWLKELVDLKISDEELVKLLPLRTIGTKEVTDNFIELDMKGYNRADLLSMRGVAYEVGAISSSPVKFKEISDPSEFIWTQNKWPEVLLEVENEKDTPVYCIAKIENLKVEQSNASWVNKLSNSGMRSVNNLADVTNLIMLEFGQPLHAFDADQVNGKIIVRRSKPDEAITTLDNKKRDLDHDILITDESEPIGIAGIMGGKNSEVSDNTNIVYLEAAIFDPKSLKKTSQRLNLNSEAGKRFYHGLSQIRLFDALNKALKMYEELGGKVTGLTIKMAKPHFPQKPIKLGKKKVSNLIGIELDNKEIEESLTKLGFDVKDQGDSFDVTPPFWRMDVEIAEDLIEEVARMYGYEKIPGQALEGQLPEKVDQSLFEFIDNIKVKLVELGLTEVQTYSFYSTRVLGALGFNRDLAIKHLIKVANPMSSETEFMRKDLWPNLVEVVDKNIRQGFEDIAIFEIGKTYGLTQEGEVEEKNVLSLALMNKTDNPISELSALLKRINLEIDTEETSQNPALELFHPKRFRNLKYQNMTIGELAEVHMRVLDKFGISQRVAILQIDLTPLIA